jgi:quercetin 2,3-dioxygenase
MKLNTIKYLGKSVMVNMGPIRLRQPIPTRILKDVDPFVLLHHYGPYEINSFNNPFDLGPHPHRGFEPITFLIQGEQLHKDSLGNESIVRAGDVQWTTAGRGIIHSEGPTKAFVEKGGVLEGIQLWLNLPSSKKMMSPNYQHIKSNTFNEITSSDNKVTVKVIAGFFKDAEGKIRTQTSVNAYMIDFYNNGVLNLPINQTHQSLIYLLHGSVIINGSTVLKEGENQLIEFNNDGTEVNISSLTESKLLFLSGVPIKEDVVNYGPYVMNNQTEILEAMRDYQQGKMGFLPV